MPPGHLTPQRREVLNALGRLPKVWRDAKTVGGYMPDVSRLAVKDRLNGLVEHGYLERRETPTGHGLKHEYLLTPKGEQHVDSSPPEGRGAVRVWPQLPSWRE